MKGKNCRQCSGQILVIAVFVVSVILLSTQLYIYETSRSLERERTVRVADFVSAVRLGSKHVVIGSLANISQGRNNSNLESSLDGWTHFVGSLYQFGKPVLNFMLNHAAPYNNGTHISWETNGSGVSSAHVDFTLSLTQRQAQVQLPYIWNLTTSLMIHGFHRTVSGNTKQINVTCSLFNEEHPTLAQNITVLFETSNSWLSATEQSNYNFTDHGNGTYTASFEAEALEESVNVSAQAYDMRGIYVQANTTCVNTP